jgi:mannosyltransferase
VPMGRLAVARVQGAAAARGRVDLVAIAGLGAATLALGLYRSNSTSLWTDELFSLTLANKPLPLLMRQLWSENANMSLYYLLLGGWLSTLNQLGLTHPTEWLIRMPSIMFAVGAVVAAYFIGRRMYGLAVGLVGAILLLLNYVFLMEVAQARAYSLELFLQLIGWHLLIRILENPTSKGGRLGLAFGVVMGLAMYADLYTALVIVAQLAAFLALIIAGSISRDRARKAMRPAIIASLTLIVSVAPLALDVLAHGAANQWIAVPGLREVLTFAGAVSGANPALALVLIVGAALGLSIAARSREEGKPGRVSPRTATIFLATWIAVPFVLSWGLSHKPFGLHLFLTRYLLVIVPAICILAAAGLHSISKSNARVSRLILVASLLVAVSTLPEYYARVQREDFKTASAWFVQRYHTGDGVACASLGCAFALEYYAPGKLQAGDPGQYVWGDGNFAHVPGDPATLAEYAQTHNRIFLVYGTAGQYAYISPDEQWLQDHNYRLVDRVVTVPGSAGAVTVELFAKQ